MVIKTVSFDSGKFREMVALINRIFEKAALHSSYVDRTRPKMQQDW